MNDYERLRLAYYLLYGGLFTLTVALGVMLIREHLRTSRLVDRAEGRDSKRYG